MKIHLLFLAFILYFVSGRAQQGRQYSFSFYNTSNGSISNQVNSVVQDKDGYIWTATTDGLQRFDGTKYRLFRHRRGDPHSLPSNPVWRVKMDKKNNLWLLLGNGEVGIFDTRTFRFTPTPVRIDDPTRLYTHKELKFDESGTVFLLLRGETFLTWNEEKNEFSTDHNFISLTDSMKVIDLIHQPGTKKYWISTSSGLAIYNRETDRLSYLNYNRENEKAIDDFRELGITGHYFFDSKGRLWFDSWKSGLPAAYAYDSRTQNFEVFRYTFIDVLRSYYEIHGFFEQKNGSIWLYGLGLFAEYIEGTKKFQFIYNGYRNGKSIYYDGIQEMYEDREENVWVATKNHGLYSFNPSHDFFTNLSHTNRVTGEMGNGSVMSFIQSNRGTMLVGTWGDGIYHYNKDLDLIPVNLSGITEKQSPTIWSMVLSRDGNTIWAGAQPGICRIDQAGRSLVHYQPPALMNKTVRQIAEDGNGNLWIGLQNAGLYKWDKNKGGTDFNRGVSRFEAVPSSSVNKLEVDSKGRLWVATANFGLYVIEPATGRIIYHFYKDGKDAFKTPEPGISSFLEYNDSLTLITTGTELLAFNEKRITTKNITPGDGLSGFVASLEKDRKGYVWLSTTSGLYRVNIQQGIFIRFTRDDGIDNDNFVLAASYALPDGRLAFGSSNEFVVFDPEHMSSHQVKPEVYITDFRVMNQSLRLDSIQQLDLVRLGSKANSVHIEFSTLRYAIKYQVRYMLEGLDKEWIYEEPGDNQAVYSYLPGGTYTFRLQAINEEGELGKETLLRFRVTPPFWKSWWFFSGVILVAGLILFWLDRERTKRKKAIQDMRADISGNLHGEINTALSNINILSEMARLKAKKDPVKAEEYIEQIHTKSHNMIIAMDDMLWSLDARNDNMKTTVERMREYIEALNNRHGVYIDMITDKSVEQLKLNMKLRHEAFLLFKEGIHNLVQCGIAICHIHLTLEKQQLVFSMQFDTETCNMQQLNNLFHRHDMEKRIESIHAEMNVQVHKNSTMVILRIPLY